jgi:hypothetical protein
MATIQCKDFLELIEPWMEGERHPEAQAHLGGCGRCRALVADLDTIRTAAPHLTEAHEAPPERIWLAVRAKLEEEGYIREHGWTAWLPKLSLGLPRPALAVAYASLLVAATMLVGIEMRHFSGTGSNEAAWLIPTQVETASLDHQLQGLERDTLPILPDHNPAVSTSLKQNLAIVDNYIALCKKSVDEDPQNEMARDYLYDAYHQKADLLATMADRGVTGR